MAEPLHFGPNLQSGLEVLAGAPAVSHNTVVEPNGAVRRRPGIAAYAYAPSEVIDENGIAGLHATQDGALYAVGGASGQSRPIYYVTGGGAVDISSGARLAGTRRPIFAETEMLLAIAAGAAPHKVELATLSPSRLGGDPQPASHIVAHASRLVMNDLAVDRTVGHYTGAARGLLTYAGLEVQAGQFGADAKPDHVVAIANNTAAVWLFGTRSTQMFAADPRAIFAPIGANALETGCAAPYSVIGTEAGFYWLDNRKRFVQSDGRGYSVISGPPIARVLETVSDVGDCYGYAVQHGFVNALVWTLPNAGVTFAYQVGSGWSQWTGWDDDVNNWARFAVLSHHQHSGNAANLVGTLDGRIGMLSQAAHTDLGARINARATTGFQSRGTDAYKQCVAVRLTLRRGQASSGNPVGRLRWRDNLGPYNGGIPVHLGRSGDDNPSVEFRGLGTYRRRDWEFSFDGTDEVVLAHAEEDFVVLSH